MSDEPHRPALIDLITDIVESEPMTVAEVVAELNRSLPAGATPHVENTVSKSLARYSEGQKARFERLAGPSATYRRKGG